MNAIRSPPGLNSEPVPAIQACARLSTTTIAPPKTRGRGRGVAGREQQGVDVGGNLRALSSEPVQGGDTGGASPAGEEVFIRGGGEFGDDGDPGTPPPLDRNIVTGPSEKVM